MYIIFVYVQYIQYFRGPNIDKYIQFHQFPIIIEKNIYNAAFK